MLNIGTRVEQFTLKKHGSNECWDFSYGMLPMNIDWNTYAFYSQSLLYLKLNRIPIAPESPVLDNYTVTRIRMLSFHFKLKSQDIKWASWMPQSASTCRVCDTWHGYGLCQLLLCLNVLVGYWAYNSRLCTIAAKRWWNLVLQNLTELLPLYRC